MVRLRVETDAAYNEEGKGGIWEIARRRRIMYLNPR